MRWSIDEIAFLKNNYPDRGMKYCVENLNRTRISIERMVERLKIRSNFFNKKWTDVETKFLVENYIKNGNVFCSKQLNKSCYGISAKARKLGLKLDVNIKLTKEEYIKICNKYVYYTDFYKKESKVYQALYNNGWLKECTKNLIKIKKEPIFWTKAGCFNEALKYMSKKEWYFNSRSSLRAAEKNGWANECSLHMNKLGCRHDRLIYSFEFEDNSVYVGLTYSAVSRKNFHLKNKKSEVYKHIKKTNLFPEFNILTDYLEKNIASIKEGEILNDYLINGWVKLNRAKTGGLGGNKLIWTKNSCIEGAKKYNSRSEFSIKNNSAYDSARNNGWLDEACSHMSRLINPTGYWTKERCFEEALKHNNRSSFIKKSKGAYSSAFKNGWFNEVCSHMEIKHKPKNYWNKEMCTKEALKYNGRYEFQKNSMSAYRSAILNGWLDDVCSHMVISEIYLKTQKNNER